MVYEAVTREEKRVFVDAFFEGFALYCKTLGLTMKSSLSSNRTESIYTTIKKANKEWTVRISTHEYPSDSLNNVNLKKQCDFDFVCGDELYDKLVKFTDHFNPPPKKTSKKIRKKKTVP